MSLLLLGNSGHKESTGRRRMRAIRFTWQDLTAALLRWYDGGRSQGGSEG
jgi:hypothetical protein